MSGDITKLVPTIELARDGKIVVIELHCTDEMAACVLMDDIADKITNGSGLRLSVRGEFIREDDPA